MHKQNHNNFTPRQQQRQHHNGAARQALRSRDFRQDQTHELTCASSSTFRSERAALLSALLGASFWDALNTPHRGAKASSGRALLLLLAEQEGANTRLIRAHIAPDSIRAFLRVLDAETSSPFGWSQTRTVQRARFPRQSARSADFDLIDRSRPNTKRSNKPAQLRRLKPNRPPSLDNLLGGHTKRGA